MVSRHNLSRRKILTGFEKLFNCSAAVKEKMTEDEHAYEYAKEALKLMAKNAVKPTPHNYAIWYTYIAQGDEDLVGEINTMIAQNVAFTPEMNDYLFTSYIAEGDDQFVREAAANAKQMVQNMLTAVQNFSGEASMHQQEIDEQAGKLPTGSDEITQEVVQQIISSATAMKDSSENLNAKLDKSRQEVEELRESLAQATKESEHDFLTEIYNRKALEKKLAELMKEAKDDEFALCLLMVDIDHFKKFNDTHGHLIGDQVIKIVAKTLKNEVKGADIVARYGGEEFCVVLPRTALRGGIVVANGIREAIAAKELKRKDTGENYGSITVSIGVALFQRDHDTIPTFIKRADDALYQSKKKGRNCVTQESGLSS